MILKIFNSIKKYYIKLIDSLPIDYQPWERSSSPNFILKHIINVSESQGLRACKKNCKYAIYIDNPNKDQVWSALDQKGAYIIGHLPEHSQTEDMHIYCLNTGVNHLSLKGLKKETLINFYNSCHSKQRNKLFHKPPVILQSYFMNEKINNLDFIVKEILIHARVIPDGDIDRDDLFQKYWKNFVDEDLSLPQLALIMATARKNIHKYNKEDSHCSLISLDKLLKLCQSHHNYKHMASSILKEIKSL